MRVSVGLVATFCLVGVSISSGAQAQSVASITPSQSTEAVDTAIRAVLADASNPATSFRLVEVASLAGDYRTAIAALERILLINPQLSNIKLELGVLYLRNGSPALAERYISEALADPAAPPEVRDRAKLYLDNARRQLQPLIVSGSVGAGLRYESNANAATDLDSVTINGILKQIDPGSQGKADGSALFSASLSLSYDLGSQAGHRMVTDISYFGSKYFTESDQNIDALSLSLGPELRLDWSSGATIRPYGVAQAIYKAEQFYDGVLGVGVVGRLPLSTDAQFFVDTRVIYHNFQATDDDPLNDNRDGWQGSLVSGIQYAVTSDLLLSADISAIRTEARVGYEAYWQGGGEISLAKSYPSLFSATSPAWSTTAAVAYQHRIYDDPDDKINVTDAQTTDRFDASLTTIAPFNASFAAVFEIFYTKNLSNYDINDYDNYGASLSVRAVY